MKSSRLSPSADQTLPSRFGLLCWNVNKSRRIATMRELFQRWRKEWDLELILLQEARWRGGAPFILEGFDYRIAPNLRFRTRGFGVLDASRIPPLRSAPYLSKGREVFVGPRKSFLIEYFPAPGGHTLLLVNLHGINFRETRRFREEIARLGELIAAHEGPMVVAGDFNAWSGGRQRSLEVFRREVGLEEVPFEGVKSFRGRRLDFVLYREVRPLRHRTHYDPVLSDHSALLVEFAFETPVV
ncbi:endonuclease/exonuclease/phosphatase family protein [Nitratifractor sp.]